MDYNPHRDMQDALEALRKLLNQMEDELRRVFDCDVRLERSDILLNLIGPIIRRLELLRDTVETLASQAIVTSATWHVLVAEPSEQKEVDLVDAGQERWFKQLYDCQTLLIKIAVSIFRVSRTDEKRWHYIVEGLSELRHSAIDVETQIERSISLLPQTATGAIDEAGLPPYPPPAVQLGAVELPFERIMKRSGLSTDNPTPDKAKDLE